MNSKNVVRTIFALLVFLGLAMTLNWCGLGYTEERVIIIKKPASPQFEFFRIDAFLLRR